MGVTDDLAHAFLELEETSVDLGPDSALHLAPREGLLLLEAVGGGRSHQM